MTEKHMDSKKASYIGIALIACFVMLFIGPSTQHSTENKASIYPLQNSATDWVPPDGYVSRRYTLSHSAIEFLDAPGMHGRRVIYYIHGGGYVGGIGDMTRELTVRYSQAAQYADVAMIDYRTSPYAMFTDARDDALHGYQFLLDKGYSPDNIVFFADSAGGHLALSILMELRDKKQKLPSRVVLFSPLVDTRASGESYTTNRNKDKGFRDLFDRNQGFDISPIFPKNFVTSAMRDDPMFALERANYAGLPPIYIQVGGDEMMRSDGEFVYKKTIEAGGVAKVSIYPGELHVFHLVGQGSATQIEKAWRDLRAYLGGHQ